MPMEPQLYAAFHGEPFNEPPENFDEMLPIDFLKMFWTDITDLITEQICVVFKVKETQF